MIFLSNPQVWQRKNHGSSRQKSRADRMAALPNCTEDRYHNIYLANHGGKAMMDHRQRAIANRASSAFEVSLQESEATHKNQALEL